MGLKAKIVKSKKPEKRRRQFSKLHVAFADFLVFFVFCVSAWLSWHDKMPVSDVAIAIITAYGAFATGGYFALSGVRDCSKNRHGLTSKEEFNND